MSKQLDERVVSMQFDNRHFEQNVATTMSTLDKLKQKLNFKGASDGLDNVSASAKKVDMSGLANGVETVRARFSALDVIGVTALANITNSAVNAGKRIVSALTIDPIKTGFQEYETQINAVQTILANTSSKGTTIDDVNKALEQLNKYADQTIYNFTEMTRNIGTFTAAGVDLDTSVSAIKGIANLAAVSGSTSQQASTAMYQLSQALATGTVKLQDWNSVVNAGMGGEVFQNALVRTAAAMSGAADDVEGWRKKNIDSYGSFRDSLTQGAWLTTDVLTETLNQFTMAAEENSKEWEKYKKSLMDDGYTEKQAEEILKMANTATDAATKVKTFTQLWGVLKEAAQSGWSQSWKIIIGDFEQAKEMLTPLSEALTNIINKMSDWRNAILESAFGRGFSSIGDKVRGMLEPLEGVGKAVSTVSDALKEYDVLVDEIIGGAWGNGQARWDKLAEAGYDWAHAQNLVNEKLGDSTRHATNYAKGQDKVTDSTKQSTKALDKWTDAEYERLEALVAMSDEELRALGYTEEQIAAFRELEALAKKLGLSITDLMKNIDDINGRWLMVEGFKNLGKSLVEVFTAIGDAWKATFTSLTKENIADVLFNMLAGFHRFSTGVLESVKANADKIQRTFQGLFSILKIVTTLVGGPLKIAFKLLSALFGALDLNIWDITAVVGDAIVKFEQWLSSILDFEGIAEGIVSVVKSARDAIRDWSDETKFFTKIFGTIKDVISDAASGIRKWIDGLRDAKDLPKAIAEGIVRGFKQIPVYLKTIASSIKSAFTGAFDGLSFDLDPNSFLGKFVNSLKIAGQVVAELGKMLLEKINGVLTKHGFQEISIDMIQGLVDGIKSGAVKAWNAIIELGKQLIEKIKGVLGIHSPSTVFFAIGGFIISGLIGGLLAGSGDLKGAMHTLGTKLGEFFGEVDFKTIFSAVLSAGLLKALLNISSGIKSFGGVADGIADMFDGIGDLFQNISGVVQEYGKLLKSRSLGIKATAIKDIAIALAILVGAVVVLTLVDQSKLLGAIGTVAALGAVLAAMFVLINFIGKNDPGQALKGLGNVFKLSTILVSMGLSLILMAAALKILESIDPDKAAVAFTGLGACILALLGVLATYGLLVKGKSAQNIGAAGKMLKKMAVALLLMAIVIKILGSMDDSTLGQGLAVMTAFVGIIAALTLISKLAGKKVGSVGKTILQMAGAFALMALTVAVLGNIETDTLGKGLFALTAFTALMVGMVAMTKLAGRGNMKTLGSTLLSMAGAMAIMALVVKLLGTMEVGALAKGIVAVALLGGIITGLIASTKLLGRKGLKYVGSALLGMAIAIGIMGVVAALLGSLSLEHLAKGVGAVAIMGSVMALMIAATKNVGAEGVTGSLIAMSVAIGVMAVAVVALSMIEWNRLAPAVAGMAILMGMFALIIKSSQYATGSIGVLIVMSLAVGLMGGVIYLLAQLPIESTIGSAIALSTLLLAMSGAIFILSKMNMTITSALMGVLALTLMAVPLAAFVGVLALMQNIQNATINALALCALAGVMTLLLIPLTVIGTLWTAAFLGVAALTLMAVPLLAFVGVLALMQNVQNAQTNAELLRGLMTTMTLLLIPLTLIGVFWPMAFLGVAALTLMAVPMVAFVGVLALMDKVQPAQENANLLIGLMTTMTNLLVKLAIVGPLALIGVTAMAALTLLIAGIGAFAIGVGALMDKFPDLEGFLDKGIPILNKLAYAVGELAGNLISGFVETVAGSLPTLGTALSAFMINAAPFITGIKTIDSSMLEGIGVLTSAILLLTAADFINGIASFLGGGSSFADLGTELSAFMTNAQPFIEGIKGVDSSSFEAVGALADAILKLTASNVLEGLTSWFAGETSLSAFGEDLAAFGPSMKTYADAVAGIDTEAVKVSADAAKTLAEMADSLPNEGGLLGKIFGENSMETFGTQLTAFGKSLTDYSIAVTGLQTEPIYTSVDATNALSEMAASIPNLGGVVSWFTGDNSLETFGTQLVAYGNSLSAYSISVAGLQTEGIDASVNATEKLSGMATAIPNLGGVVAFFTGDNSLATFGTQLVAFGSSLMNYAATVTGLAVEPIENSVTAAKKLTGLAKAVPESGLFVSDDLANFARDIKPFGTAIKSYASSVAGISVDAVASSVTAAKKLISLIKEMGNVDSGNAKEFKKALGHLAESSVDDFIDAFDKSIPDLEDIGGDMMKAVADGAKDKASKVADAAKDAAEDAAEKAESKDSKFKSAGKKLVEAFADGIEAKSSTAKSAVKSVASDAADGADDKKSSFTSAGKDMVSGFASGITANTFKAEAAARTMAQAALDAAKEKLKINSPSKVFMAMAASIPEGFAMGIDKFQGMVVNSASDMATTAISSVKRSISRLGNLIDSDIETQPTIRPVLDLSDVKSNASKIDSLLGFNPSVGVLANVGSISSMMSSQNGVNDDVVAAINKLSKGLDNVGNTTYSINGITYDDGSNIADAMRTITRAAKMGRRV